MTSTTLVARANEGAGTDQLAGFATPTGFAAAIVQVSEVGVPFGTAVPFPVHVMSAAGAIPISAAALPLPAGAATADAQASLIAAIGTPLQAGGTVNVANLPATQPVSVVSLPLPTGAATNAALATIDADLTTLIARTPVNGGGAPFVTTAREKFRDAFLTYDTAANWTTVQTGAGMAITVAGVAGGARYLNIASGTTINAETIITSKTLFKAPCSIIVGLSMSQRIANCDAFIEMVECDASGVAIDDTAQPSARFKNARNGASFQFNGTVATTQTVNVRQDGLSEVTASGTFTTTAATGVSPNFIPAGLFEITLRTRDIQFSSVAVDANAAKTAPLARTMRVPNPDALYMLRIRVLNGAVAPATSTDIRVHSVVVLHDTRMTVDFGSIAGAANLLNALAVQVLNTVTVAGSVTSTLAASAARVGFVAGAGIWYDDSAVTLAANAIFTGTSRDAAGTATATAFANAATFAQEVRACAESDVAGTLWLEVSRDNVTFRRIRSVAAVAIAGGGFAAELIYSPSWRYWRVGYTNGATAQARFTLGTVATAL